MKYISYVVIINVSCTSYKMFRSQRSCWIETKWNVKTWKSFCQRRWHSSATWVCRYTHSHSCLLIEACCFCWGHTNAENSPANTKDKNSDPCEGQTTSGKNKTHNNQKKQKTNQTSCPQLLGLFTNQNKFTSEHQQCFYFLSFCAILFQPTRTDLGDDYSKCIICTLTVLLRPWRNLLKDQ